VSLAARATITLGYGIEEQVHLSPLTPLAFLERTAAVFPDAIGVVDEDRRLTWAELRERARRLAVALQQAGIEAGDRVAFLALNTTELLEAHFGVPRAGAVLVAVNTRLLADEIEYIVVHSGARILVVDPSLAHLVEGAPVQSKHLERVLVLGEAYEAHGDYSAAARNFRLAQLLTDDPHSIAHIEQSLRRVMQFEAAAS